MGFWLTNLGWAMLTTAFFLLWRRSERDRMAAYDLAAYWWNRWRTKR